MALAWSLLKRAKRLQRLTYMGVILVVLVLIVRVLAITPIGHHFAEAQIEKLTPRGLSIEVESLSGDLFGTIKVGELRLSDAEGLWLEADEIVLAWGPLAIFRKHLKIERIVSDRLRIIRRPALTESPDDSQGSSSIAHYTLSNLHLPNILIDEQLIGRAEKFSLEAKLQSFKSSGQISLKLTPARQGSDRVDGTLVWSADAPLSGTVELFGPQNGFLAELLQISQPGDIIGTIEGAGTFEDWRTVARLSVEATTLLDIRIEGQNNKVTLNSGLLLAGFKPLSDISEQVGPFLTLEANRTAEYKTIITAATDKLRATLSGTISTETLRNGIGPFDVTLVAEAPLNLLQLNDGQSGPAQINGQVIQSGQDFIFTGAAHLKNIEIESITAEQIEAPFTVSTDTDFHAFSIDTRLTGHNVSATGLPADFIAPKPRLATRLTINAETGDVNISSVALNTAVGGLNASGLANYKTGALDLSGEAQTNRQVQYINPGAIDWSLNRSASNEPINALLYSTIDTQSLKTPWAQEPLKMHLDLQASPEGILQINRAQVRNDSIGLSASGMVNAEALNLAFKLEADENQYQALQIAKLQASGTLSGSPENPVLNMAVQETALNVSGILLDIDRLALKAEQGTDTVEAAISYAGKTNGQPTELSATVRHTGENWAVENFSGSYNGLDFSGAATGKSTDFSTIVANLDISGGLPLSGAKMPISGNISLIKEKAHIDLITDRFDTSVASFEAIRLQGGGDAREAFFGTLLTQGILKTSSGPAPFKVTTEIDTNTASQTLTLIPSGEIADEIITTLDPIIFHRTDGGVSASGLLELLGGTLGIRAIIQAGETQALLNAVDLEIEPLATLYSRPGLKGTLSLRSEYSNTAGIETGNANISLINLTQGDPDSSKINLQSSLMLENNIIGVKTNLNDLEKTVQLDISGTVPVAANQPLSLSMKGGTALAPLWAVLGIPEIQLTGDFLIEAAIEGTRLAPRPIGTFSISNASLEDSLHGFALKDIALNASLTPDGMDVSTISANGARSGTLSGAGMYNFDGTSSVEMHFYALNPLQRQDLNLTLSGPVHLSQKDNQINLSGELDFDHAEIDIDTLPQGNYQTLDVKFVDIPETETVTDEMASPLTLDIGLRADRRIFITGNGLSTEWSIDTRLIGSAADPRLIGQANIFRGDIDLAGRLFQFRNSRILFDGAITDARLDLFAERVTSDLTAGFIVTGSALAPEFRLTSDPNLPDPEILSRILFGRSPSSLGPLQAAQLGAAITSLSTGGRVNPVGAIQNALGIDRLDVGISETGETSFGVGEYIGDNFYVELRTNPRGETRLGVEWTPRDNIAVTSEIGPEEPPSFGLKWRREFGAPKLINQDETRLSEE